MTQAYDPRVVEIVRVLKGRRICKKSIAMSVGLSQRQVQRLCASRNIRRPPPDRVKLRIGAELFLTLHAEACRRKISMDRLLRLLLIATIKDNLFTAILDDGK